MQLTGAEKIEEKGRKQGKKEGRLEGKRDALLQLLTSKFGPLPEKTVSRVRGIQSLKQLERHLDRVLVATSLAAMGLKTVRLRDFGASAAGSVSSGAASTLHRPKGFRARYREVMKMEAYSAEKVMAEGRSEGWKQGRQEGRQEGRQVGMVKGKRKALERQLTTKFGPLPKETSSRVRALDSLEELDHFLDRMLVAGSLAAMGLETARTASTSDRAKRAQKPYQTLKTKDLTWADKLKEKGRREGWKEGRRQGRWEGLREGLFAGKREALVQQLTAKFGRPLEKTASRVCARASLRELDRYLDRLLVASSLADIGLRLSDEPPIVAYRVNILPYAPWTGPEGKSEASPSRRKEGLRS